METAASLHQTHWITIRFLAGTGTNQDAEFKVGDQERKVSRNICITCSDKEEGKRESEGSPKRKQQVDRQTEEFPESGCHLQKGHLEVRHSEIRVLVTFDKDL